MARRGAHGDAHGKRNRNTHYQKLLHQATPTSRTLPDQLEQKLIRDRNKKKHWLSAVVPARVLRLVGLACCNVGIRAPIERFFDYTRYKLLYTRSRLFETKP